MNGASKEFLGTCDCMSADGRIENIASYRMRDGAGAVIVHRSQNMQPAYWCDATQAFYVEGQAFRPTEPLLQMTA